MSHLAVDPAVFQRQLANEFKRSSVLDKVRNGCGCVCGGGGGHVRTCVCVHVHVLQNVREWRVIFFVVAAIGCIGIHPRSP